MVSKDSTPRRSRFRSLKTPAIIVDTSVLSETRKSTTAQQLLTLASTLELPVVIPATVILERLQGINPSSIADNFHSIWKAFEEPALDLLLAAEPNYQILHEMRGNDGLLVLEAEYANEKIELLSNPEFLSQYLLKRKAELEKQKERKNRLVCNDKFARKEFSKNSSHIEIIAVKKHCLNFPGAYHPDLREIRNDVFGEIVRQGIRKQSSHRSFKRRICSRRPSFTKAYTDLMVFRHLLNSFEPVDVPQLQPLCKLESGNWTDMLILAHAYNKSIIFTKDVRMTRLAKALSDSGVISTRCEGSSL